MSSGYICLSSGIPTVYKSGRGTPATRLRSTLGTPSKRAYTSEWKKRKDRMRETEKVRKTTKINHALLKEIK